MSFSSCKKMNFKEFNCSWFEEEDLFYIQLEDYSIISNFDLKNFESLFPKEIKPLLNENWFFHLHVYPIRLNRQHLQKKVESGGILAYSFTDLLSIGYNDCTYIGFLPTKNQNFEDSFKEIIKQDSFSCENEEKNKCSISMQKVWPRNISVQLKKVGKCVCTNINCFCIEYLDRNLKSQKCCMRAINFADVYIIMGSFNALCDEGFKEPRICTVCANCYKCSKSVSYCKTHAKKCNHKTASIDKNKIETLYVSEFQKCKPYQ